MADPGAAVATTAELQSPKGILKNKEDGLNRSMEDLTVVCVVPAPLWCHAAPPAGRHPLSLSPPSLTT